LPFTLTAPGTYVLVSDLACAPSTYAITIPTNLTGPVIVDLKGFTITGAGISIGQPPPGPAVSNAFPITVRNGTITNVAVGVSVQTVSIAVLSSITISNLTITVVAPPPSYCIMFNGYVENSVVRDCTFNTANYGILDLL
jgi:hypothetical protein